MRDDIIGTFGDTVITGKPVGDDLREGKPTPLLARAVARAGPDQRRVLDRVGVGVLDDAEIAAIQAVIVETGALEALEEHIAALTAEAVAALDRIDLAAEAREELTTLASYVAARVV